MVNHANLCVYQDLCRATFVAAGSASKANREMPSCRVATKPGCRVGGPDGGGPRVSTVLGSQPSTVRTQTILRVFSDPVPSPCASRSWAKQALNTVTATIVRHARNKWRISKAKRTTPKTFASHVPTPGKFGFCRKYQLKKPARFDFRRRDYHPRWCQNATSALPARCPNTTSKRSRVIREKGSGLFYDARRQKKRPDPFLVRRIGALTRNSARRKSLCRRFNR